MKSKLNLQVLQLETKRTYTFKNPLGTRPGVFYLRGFFIACLFVVSQHLSAQAKIEIVILIGFLGLLFYIDGFLFRLFTGILCVSYVAAILFNIYMVRNYLREPAPDQSLKEYLTKLLNNMNKAFRSVELIALMIYPIAMTAGFLLPLTLEGKIDLIYNEPVVQGILIACYIVLTPLCWYFAKYMNKVAFGKYLNQLEDILKDLNRQD